MAKTAESRPRPAARRKGAEKLGRRRLEVRHARAKDIPGIAALVRRVYNDMPAYTHGEIRGQINNFREGCFVALLDQHLGLRAAQVLKPAADVACAGIGFFLSRHWVYRKRAQHP